MPDDERLTPDQNRLEKAIVTSLPKTAYYIPNFISIAEEAQLMREIASQPKSKWIVLSHRRLQTHPSALSSTDVLLSAPLPSWLSSLIPRMQGLGIWESAPHKAPNHVLVNEYNLGEGIMAHQDGAAYYPMVATISLGSPIVLDIYEKTDGGVREPRWRILQEPRR
jgi:alkylated DNA repair protein alkB family protein 6